MTTIISVAVATRTAIRAIAAKNAIAEIDKDTFKVLYVSNKNYGKISGEDFANHPNEGVLTTALKFKAVVNLVQNGDLWLSIPTARAAAMGLDCAGSWVFSNEDVNFDEALDLVKATKEEASEIRNLWNTIGIRDDGYVIDEDGEEVPYAMPRTAWVVEWMAL